MTTTTQHETDAAASEAKLPARNLAVIYRLASNPAQIHDPQLPLSHAECGYDTAADALRWFTENYEDRVALCVVSVSLVEQVKETMLGGKVVRL